MITLLVASSLVGMVVVASVVFLDRAVYDLFGFGLAVGTVAALAVGDVATDLYFANKYRPSAIRPSPAGVDVRRAFGALQTLAWSLFALGEPGTGRPFIVLRFRPHPQAPIEITFLTAAQAVAVRSSPYRPPDWPSPNWERPRDPRQPNPVGRSD